MFILEFRSILVVNFDHLDFRRHYLLGHVVHYGLRNSPMMMFDLSRSSGAYQLGDFSPVFTILDKSSVEKLDFLSFPMAKVRFLFLNVFWQMLVVKTSFRQHLCVGVGIRFNVLGLSAIVVLIIECK